MAGELAGPSTAAAVGEIDGDDLVYETKMSPDGSTITAGKYRSIPSALASKSWLTAGLEPVTTSTSLRHDRLALSPAGTQASLPATHRWPALQTADMKWSSVSVV